MYVLYLNPVFRDAIKAQHLSMKEATDVKLLGKYFSYDDINVMSRETDVLLNSIDLKNYGFINLLEDRVYCDDGYPDEMRTELLSNNILCEAIDTNTIVLYADSIGVRKQRATIENVFNALALIMPVNSIMQCRQFQQYMLL
jgi:hypothetical protein